jgi:hypothetical protein
MSREISACGSSRTTSSNYAVEIPEIAINLDNASDLLTLYNPLSDNNTSDLLAHINQITSKPEAQRRHTFFQLKYFILGKEPTIQARLRKCVVELQTRKENIENLRLAIEDIQDDIELANIDIKRQENAEYKDDLGKRIFEINVKKARRRLRSLENELKKMGKQLSETEEEALFFLQAYRDLEKAEPLKPFDDFETNIEYWNERYTEELKLRLLLQKPIDLELAKCILALDKKTPIRNEFVNILKQIENRAESQKKRIKNNDN